MRGSDGTSGSMFGYVDLKDRIPARHPLRKIRQTVNDALASVDSDFDVVARSRAARRLRRSGCHGPVCSISCS